MVVISAQSHSRWLSAAALHGTLWIDPDLPAELNQRSQHKTNGILLHCSELWDDETCFGESVPVTTPARTAFDIGRRRPLATAVVRLDALLRDRREGCGLRHFGGTPSRRARDRAIAQRASAFRRRRGVTAGDEDTADACRGWASTAADADSSVPRAVSGRSPRHGLGGVARRRGVRRCSARTDPRQRSRDIERIAELEALGWTIIRVSGEMLRKRPRLVVERVRAALRAAGCRI
jgi:hypothetical protein